jgi:RNA polymerase primary sigma factor
MREMGVVELLEQQDEVRIAKEIEAGVFEIMQAITLYPKISDYFFKAYARLEEGKCKMTDVIIGYQGDAEDFEEKQAFIEEKLANLKDNEDQDEEDLDQLEYTGPDEGEVYERIEKIQKAFNNYSSANKKNGYLDEKTIKARQIFSTCISDLRLAPKLVSSMMELVSCRIDEVKVKEKIIRDICLESSMPKEVFYNSFPGNETNFDWLKAVKLDKSVIESLKKQKENIYYAQKKSP